MRQKSCVLLYEAMTKLADERMGAGSSARKAADFSWFQSELRILIRIDAKNSKLFLPIFDTSRCRGQAVFVGATPHSWRRGRDKRRELGNELGKTCSRRARCIQNARLTLTTVFRQEIHQSLHLCKVGGVNNKAPLLLGRNQLRMR